MAAATVKRFSRFFNLWAPVIACMAVIFYASSIAGKNIPAIFPNEDVLYHGSIYAILGLLFYRALKNTDPRISGFRLLILTVVFGAVYGATDEFHQRFTPGRSCSGIDLAVDTAGSSIGAIIGGIFLKWLK
jgi:VanZ family protein